MNIPIKCISGYFSSDNVPIVIRSIHKVFNMNDEEQLVYSKDKQRCISTFGCLYDNMIPKLYTIGNAGFLVFMYICRNIEFNCNYIKLVQTDIAKEVGITHPVVGKGIKSLLDKGIIKKVKDKPFIYVINHLVYFKGDIVKLINKLKEDEQKS